MSVDAPAPLAARGQPFCTPRVDRWATALVLVAYTVLCLMRIAAPASWGDEVQFADPGANLYFNHAFVTTAWPYQTVSEVFFGNAPLYSLALGGWYHLVGFGLFQTRILGWLLAVAGILTAATTAERARLVPAGWRAVLVALFLAGYGVSLSIWSARYDMPGFAVLAAVLWGIVARGSRAGDIVRLVALFTVPLAGFHLVVVVGVLYLLLLWLGRCSLRSLVIDLGAMAAGLAAMLAFYAVTVGLKRFVFLTIFSNHTVFGQVARGAKLGMAAMVERKWAGIVGVFTQDPPYALALAGALGLAWRLRRHGGPAAPGRTDVALIAGALALPLLLSAIGKYPAYYSWIGWAVTCLLFVRLLARWPQGGAWVRPLAAGAMVLACSVLGPGAYLSSALGQAPSASFRARLYTAIDQRIAPGEIAYAEMSTWFDTWRRARLVYAETYAQNHFLPGFPTPRPITALVIERAHRPRIEALVGGRWVCGDLGAAPARGEPDILICKRLP